MLAGIAKADLGPEEEELLASFGGVAAESPHPLIPKGLPTGEVPGAPLTPEQRLLIEEEDFYRTIFATNRTAPEAADPYVSLLDVFKERETFKYTPEDPLERRVPKLLAHWRETNLEGYSVVDEATFHRNWNEFTKGMFEGMDWSNVFCAGGAVLACLVPQQQQGGLFRGSDIDLWIYGLTEDEQANEKVKHIHSVISRNASSRGQVVRTNRAITILGDFPYRHVQIILRLYASPLEVLLGFDIDSCCVGFNGDRVWCAKRFRRALIKRYNLINPTRRSLTYEPRLFKYSKRGFAVAIPGLRKADVDRSIFTRDVKKAQGLLKLCLFEHQTLYPEIITEKKRLPRPRGPLPEGVNASQLEQYQNGAEENQSDYTPEGVYIPWGPEWFTDQILNLLNFTDRAQFFQRPNKNPRQGNGYRHRHLFVTGIEGVINGTGFWCRLCKKEKKMQEDMSGRFVKKSLTWLKDCPAYQDIEKVFRRHLMTGSFQPILEPNWEKDVYVDQNRTTAELFFSQTPLAIALFSTAGVLVERTVMRTDKGEHRCDECSAQFPSRNQLLAHSLVSSHRCTLPPLPTASKSSNDPLPALDRGPVELSGVARTSLPVFDPSSLSTRVTASEPEAAGEGDASLLAAVPTKSPSPPRTPASSPFTPLPSVTFEPERRNRLPLGRFSVVKTSRFMVQLSMLAKDGRFDAEDRGMLKELLLLEDSVVFGAFEAHELEPDLDDLVDTLRRYLTRRRTLAQQNLK